MLYEIYHTDVKVFHHQVVSWRLFDKLRLKLCEIADDYTKLDP